MDRHHHAGKHEDHAGQAENQHQRPDLTTFDHRCDGSIRQPDLTVTSDHSNPNAEFYLSLFRAQLSFYDLFNFGRHGIVIADESFKQLAVARKNKGLGNAVVACQ